MTDLAPAASTITVALRFDRSDAEKLRDIADRAMVQDLRADVQLYRDAAAAAERGDPYFVQAHDRADLDELVAGLIFNGVEPTIEAARVD